MPLQATSGAASYDAFGGGVPVVPNYIEEVFSTYLYTGNGSTQTITNGIDLSTKGGLVWVKSRSQATENLLYDTSRGTYNYLISSTTGAQSNGSPTGVSSFNTTGFGVAGTTIGGGTNANGDTYASWTFRKQPKFFDVLTYTGDGVAGRAISHNLGSTPGCIFIKKTSSASTTGWPVYHRSATDTFFLNQNDNQGGLVSNVVYSPTDTTFTVSSYTDANASGQTYVAYLFAHDAGGFGLAGTDNVISCGGFTTDGSGNATVSLGYEPQFIIVKSRGTNGDWRIFDVMRGMPVGNTNVARLVANTTGAEALTSDFNVSPTSTGFIGKFSTSLNATYVYIAIRRGPMKVPLAGEADQVFYSNAFGDTQTSFPTGFVTDFAINKVTYFNPDQSTYTSGTNFMLARLTANSTLATNQNTTQSNLDPASFWAIQDGYKWANGSGYDIFGWAFKRAPSFADVVCYTGTLPTVNTVTHNLGAAPELMFVKLRNSLNRDWAVYSKAYSDYLGLQNRYGQLNTTVSLLQTSTDIWNNTAPTATTFQVNATDTNYNTGGLIAYLFATCPGVSKCGLFTGTGATQTIDCGFGPASARFVMVKRANSTGDWFVYDSSRGIQSGNDPYLLLNSSNAQVSNTNFVDTAAGGFQLIGGGTLNTSGGVYIFWAIA